MVHLSGSFSQAGPLAYRITVTFPYPRWYLCTIGLQKSWPESPEKLEPFVYLTGNACPFLCLLESLYTHVFPLLKTPDTLVYTLQTGLWQGRGGTAEHVLLDLIGHDLTLLFRILASKNISLLLGQENGWRSRVQKHRPLNTPPFAAGLRAGVFCNFPD